jgi:ribosomal protein S18 acetylase RimI-like enzyme
VRVRYLLTMTEAFVIRAAVPDDHAELAALLAEVDELHRLRLPWLFRAPAVEPRRREFFERLLNGDSSTLLVADAGPIVGIATVLVRTAPEFAVFISQTWGVLDNIAVAKTWRRCGVGTALTRAAETWARQQHAKWLELGVYEFNDEARGFYEALGYLPVSTKLRKPLLPDADP